MRIPLSWLKEFIKITHSPEDLSELLTMAGLEVDAIERTPDDVIFEISLTPNLIHTASILGVARELSALTKTPYHVSKTKLAENSSISTNDFVSVSIDNQETCPRYACRLIQNVKVGPSPDWLKKKLEACSIRPINNVVDITNYVLLEYGHPLHAFDYDKISGQQIHVKTAINGTEITTLDGTTRTLSNTMLCIYDNKEPIALAGIMGCKNSEVSDSTQNILLESAFFQASCIRKTSKQLFLSTEASRHFERGADPGQVLDSLDKAAMLIHEIAGGSVAQNPIDIKKQNFLPKTVTCRLSRINALLGSSFNLGEVETILKRLECILTYESQDLFHVKVPTYRGDIHSEIDIVEEVARIYGYNNLPKPSVKYQNSTLPHTPIFLFENKIREKLLSHGLQEFLTCDLISPKDIALIQADALSVAVLNPTSMQQSVLRTSLLPGLLHVVKHNIDHQVHDIFGFEIGRTHFKEEESFKEVSSAGIILSGHVAPFHFDASPQNVDFFDLKGIVENLLESLYFAKPTFKPSQISSFHPKRQASLWIENSCVGILGEAHPSLLRTFDIASKVLFAEINLHELLLSKRHDPFMRPLPQFPASERDWTVTLHENIPIQHVINLIEKYSCTILEKFELIGLYQSEKLGAHIKNATFRFSYRNPKKTLSFEEVEKGHNNIVQSALKELS
ncbi:MAG: phenylalanine--tRNA ligase subunit beta [Chlamydiales bacterium]|nr:phenylalanine--tRNA ligase subunit beta [Chlamydiales bacterium]